MVGYTTSISETGIKALLSSIGNLEVLHLDNAISVLGEFSGTITNLRHVWSKVTGDDYDRFQQFVVKEISNPQTKKS